ncbi:TPA: hypothetical protein HA273_01365 [Candidatus Bathyarchaeota archaeon]|nr:hypothetical protein [Candidatus Bathyarchaeota archaeon]HIJ08427.1 hypothetical protein [Candidatus Bathyarchaeota archaeon]
MIKEPNLKEIERRASMSYHQDGLLDIFVGVYILGFSLGILMDVLWDYGMGMILMSGILVVTVLPLWITAKRKITMPRIGFVNFGTRGANKLTAIFIGLAVAGLFAFFAFTLATFQGGSRQWLDLIFQNGMLIVGFGSLAVCILFGYSMGLKRLYGYGLLALISLVIGHFAGIFFAYILMALGTTVMVVGVALLIGFVKKYPLQGDKAIAE